MKTRKVIRFYADFLIILFLVLGFFLDNDTKYLEWKVALGFILFLFGIFLLIKTKE